MTNGIAIAIVVLVVILMMAGCAPEPTGYMSAIVEYEVEQ